MELLVTNLGLEVTEVQLERSPNEYGQSSQYQGSCIGQFQGLHIRGNEGSFGGIASDQRVESARNFEARCDRQ